MIFESRSDPRISRNPRDHLDAKIDQPRAHKLLPEGPVAVRIRVETCGRHKKFDSPHGTSTRARFRPFSIRGFREIRELAVWQNCTSPTRPNGFAVHRDGSRIGFRHPYRQKKYRGIRELSVCKPKSPLSNRQIREFREIGNGTKVDQPRRQNSILKPSPASMRICSEPLMRSEFVLGWFPVHPEVFRCIF